MTAEDPRSAQRLSWRRSILGRVAAALAVLALLAIGSLAGFMHLATMSLDSARAINLAGSLRWQSQLLLRLATERDSTGHEATRERERAASEFESRLSDPRLAAALPAAAGDPLRTAYDAVRGRWASELRGPLLAGTREGDARLVAQMSDYIRDIDALVRLLETRLEVNVRTLRALQVAALALMLLAGVVSLWLLYAHVILPLRRLMGVARRIERGDLAERAAERYRGELGHLSRNFNRMVDRLHGEQRALEERVREKTEELVLSNRQLALLYRALRRISGGDLDREALHQVFAEMQDLLEASVVCMRPAAGNVDAYTAQPAAATSDCGSNDCNDCPYRSATSFFRSLDDAPQGRLLVFPVRLDERVHSHLAVRLKSDAPAAHWKVELVRAVRQHIELALAQAKRNEERSRTAVLEERAAMARDLHDSLAQALTYANVQLMRLDGLDDVKRSAEAGALLRELRTGVATAYRRLRELITTFRTRPETQGLHVTIAEAARDCRRQFGLEVRLEDLSGEIELSPDERNHVLQIVREALANAARHARACEVRLALAGGNDGGLRVRVEDDGQGLRPPGDAPLGHYGLAIMRERAAQLGGRLEIGAREEGGTRVELNFVPAALRRTPVTRG